jgi:alkylhydroperoxidase family enzyme
VPRIRPLTKDEVAEEYQPAFEQAERSMGAVPGGMGIQAYCPPILEASRALGAAPARSGTLRPLIRSLVCLRAAQMAGCPFWQDTNAAGSSRAGASHEKIAAISTFRESDLFTPEEKAALVLAEGMTQTPVQISDDEFTEAQRHFTSEQLVELVATIAMENYRARFNRTFHVEAIGVYETLKAAAG